MNIPKQPLNHRIFKYSLTSLIVVSAIWSASGLEITLDRILNAPAQIATLVGAMFPLDLSSEAFERIIPKVFESLFIAWAGTVIGAIFSFPSTGHYEINFHAQFSCQGYDSARYTHADILYTVDDSNYNVLNRSRGQSIEYPTNLSTRFSFNTTTAIFDVTNISTHKVKFRVQHDQPYLIFGSTSEVTTYVIFKKIADT